MKYLVTAVLAVGALLAAPQPAHAAGSSYNNTLPYETGCGSGAYVITSKALPGGTASMVYSPRCGTNWMEWYGDARWTHKGMGFSRTSGWTTNEADKASWSYSRQIYAPGSTVAWGHITTVVSPSSPANAYQQEWYVKCGATCSWIRGDH
ncbi:hypothetical protein [Pimelobacter sp. 30-1]|uniref:hypothetical protein n=1 Tax=Pimelobacter sp. 30-1 TaxID=2004991 RepID=UPI001C04BF76|nr:hypothetical protein [Pimelobacter sp. 30-1]MBU2698818.1 hypothetical protein [Pimelobacter sp. 30-1]